MTPATGFIAGVIVGAAVSAAVSRARYRRRAELFGRLFSFAMHELNTPITAVNMTVLNLLSEVFGELPASLKPWVEMTREQVGRLNGLVGEVRDFVHMELHRDLQANLADASVDDILDEALVSVRRGMAQASVEFKLERAENLPSVRTDTDRASRCVTSLLFHARKFRVGGPVTLAVARDGGFVRFAVSYKGAPLTPEQIEASLDMYYPARRRKDQILAATGLGLGLIRAVARLIGGDLTLATKQDGVVTAALSVPVTEAAS